MLKVPEDRVQSRGLLEPRRQQVPLPDEGRQCQVEDRLLESLQKSR